MAETIRVETKSAWLSKINWTQAVSLLVSVAVFFGGSSFDMPLETQAAIVVGIQSIQSVVTWVFKTWYTPTITPASEAMSGVKTMTLD